MNEHFETLLLNYDEVAEHLRVSRRYVEQMVAHHDLPAVRIGGNVRVRRSDLEAYVAGLAPVHDLPVPQPHVRGIA